MTGHTFMTKLELATDVIYDDQGRQEIGEPKEHYNWHSAVSEHTTYEGAKIWIKHLKSQFKNNEENHGIFLQVDFLGKTKSIESEYVINVWHKNKVIHNQTIFFNFTENNGYGFMKIENFPKTTPSHLTITVSINKWTVTRK